MQHLGKGKELVFHNVKFDFAVIEKELTRVGAHAPLQQFWLAVEQQRVHDTMLLAALVSLATSDSDAAPALDAAVRQWCGYDLPKDEFRMRFDETIGQAWGDIDPGFLRYAIADAIATFHLYEKLKSESERICEASGLGNAYGPLTGSLQVKAAICLDRIYRTGLHVDLQRVSQLRDGIDRGTWCEIETLRTIDADLWHEPRKSELAAAGDQRPRPRMNQTKLLEHLTAVRDKHHLKVGSTKTGKITKSVKKCWANYRHLDRLVDAYCRYEELTKLRSFFNKLDSPEIHPKYRTLVRTGRTSCSGPNIQQLPRNKPVREAIVARPGHLFFTIDYHSLELRTLAAVCYQQFGESKLREVLIEGIDPHTYTAAMFAKTSVDKFNDLPNKKELRQHAKVFNFGLPAGFGAAALVNHAADMYQLKLELGDAKRFIELVTEEVYPEWKLYLSEDAYSVLASRLHCSAAESRIAWPAPYGLGMLQKVTEGNPVSKTGRRYTQETITGVWRTLSQLCRNDQLRPDIELRNTAKNSQLRTLFHRPVSTLTGRMRGGVPFTAEKNTPFQGLAADGCKQAMWNLTRADYRIVAFLHDEFIIELPRESDMDVEAAKITKICSESMQPFVPGIPVPCEFALTERWHKDAEAVYDQDRRLQVWYPSQSSG